MKKLIKNAIAASLLVCLGLSLCACGGNVPSGNNEALPEGYDDAKALFENKDYTAAVESFTRLIADNPQSAACLVGRGDAYCRLFKGEEALADYKAALKISKTEGAYLGAVDASIILGDFDAALKYAKQGDNEIKSEAISKKLEAMESGNFKDSGGREHKTTTYNGKGKLIWVHINKYDSDGRRVHATSYDGNGSVTGDYECTYNENGDSLLGVWYVWDDGIFFRNENNYYPNGLLRENIGHGNDHMATNRTLNYYDDNGIKIKSEYWPNIARDEYNTSTYVWTPFGKLAEIRTVDNNGNQTSHVVYEYNEAQLNVRVDYLDKNDKLNYYYTYEFDENGKKIRELRYNSNHEIVKDTRY